MNSCFLFSVFTHMSSAKGGQLEGIHFFKNGKLFLSRKERLCLAYFFPLLVSLNEGVAYFKERGSLI